MVALALPTASKLSLAAHCLAPWAPGAVWTESATDAATALGSAVHRAIEARLRGEPVDPLAGLAPAVHRDAEAMVEHAMEYLDALVAEGWAVAEVEASYAVDLVTGRARVLGTGRAYEAASPTEICGTADVVLCRGDRWLVLDWKTGREARLTRAAASPQMRFLGLAVATLAGADEVAVELVHLDEGGAVHDSASLDVFELAAVASELRAFAGAPLRPGPWCRRCPRAAHCPASRVALARVADGLAALPAEARELSEAEARVVLTVAPLVRARLDALEEAAEAVARARGVDMGDGTVMSAVEHEGRERVEVSPRAEEILRGRGLAGALEVSTSKSAIEREARRIAPKRGGAALAREVLSELREAGAVTKGAPYVTIERRPLLRATEEKST